MAKKLHAGTIAELLDKIYAYEGWIKVEGESRSARAHTLWEFEINYDKNRFEGYRKAPRTVGLLYAKKNPGG